MINNMETLIINGSNNKPIVTDVFLAANKSNKTIIFCHGYKGFKDWGAWNLLAETSVSDDVNFVKFNFSHNGTTVNNQLILPI